MRHGFGRAVMGVLVAGALAGCATAPDIGARAEAALQPTRGNTASGVVEFVERNGSVKVVASLTGLPAGPHGFHIHERGDCSAPDAMSAGGHFNPGGTAHGSPLMPSHHAGDMPNLLADTSGKASLRTDLPGVTIGGGGSNDIVGRAVVVHRDADDFTSQPAGNSGPRVACGVIRKP